MRFTNRRQQGFSLPELLIVVLIGLTATTIALPNMLTVIANTRMRGNIATLSGIFQNCRMMAVKNNRPMTTHFDIATVGIMAYVKYSSDATSPTRSDPQVELEKPIVRYTSASANAGPSDLDTTVLGFTPQTGDASFNSRGLPCVYSGGVCTNAGFAYYFRDTRRTGNNGWAAVSISPAGRIKKWFWNGTSWSE